MQSDRLAGARSPLLFLCFIALLSALAFAQNDPAVSGQWSAVVQWSTP